MHQSTTDYSCEGTKDGVWQVVAVAADPSGVIVRTGHDLTSDKLNARLAIGSKVKQLDLQGERLHFELLSGSGPQTGWVTVKVRDKELLQKLNSPSNGDGTSYVENAQLADDYYQISAAIAGVDALSNPHPEKIINIYTAPIEYKVIFKDVVIRKEPATTAPLVGRLQLGSNILGYPQGNWLKQKDHPNGWVLIHGSRIGLGQLLAPVKFGLEIVKIVSEAAILKWDRIPARFVSYKVEWTTESNEDTVNVISGHEAGISAHIWNLPPDSELKFRVKADILTAPQTEGGKSLATICSEWLEETTQYPVDEAEEENMCLDCFANFRGRCQDCSCDAFVMAREHSEQARLSAEGMVCRRCSCSFKRHLIIGEFTCTKAPKVTLPQPKVSFKPLPETGSSQRAATVEVAAIKDMSYPSWRPEDAGSGDRIQFILDKIAQAATLYETLGITPLANDREIRSAYRHVSLHIHPDKVQNRGEKDLTTQAEAAFKIVTSAYDVLNDASQRAGYDRSIQITKPKSSNTSRKDLTSISFLKKFLSKVKSTGWDLNAKPKGDWEHQGGGRYTRATGVKITLTHFVSGDELVLKITETITLGKLKERVVEQIKRGPASRIEICNQDGTELKDSYRLESSETMVLVGISLGPPKEVEICISHAHTGARVKVMVLDTWTIQEVHTQAAKTLQCAGGNFELGYRSENRDRFQAFKDHELLNGRTQILILGIDMEMTLSVDEAVELQTELRDAYGASWFQEQLDALLKRYPPPEGLIDTQFKESFSEIARKAQQAILLKHGFDGPKGVYNMYQAFGAVGSHPQVRTLATEIDEKLRVTSGGLIKPVAQVTVESCPKVDIILESITLVSVTLESCFVWSEDEAPPALRVKVPMVSTIKHVLEAAAKRLNAGLDEMQLVQSGTFEPYEMHELIGTRRSFKLLGKDIPDDIEFHPDETAMEDPKPRWFMISVGVESKIHQVRQAAAKELKVDFSLLQLLNQSMEVLDDDEPIGERRKLHILGAQLPEADTQPTDSKKEPFPNITDAKPRAVVVVVETSWLVRHLRQAIAQKLGMQAGGVHLLNWDSLERCDDEEPIGSRRKFKVLGVEFPETKHEEAAKIQCNQASRSQAQTSKAGPSSPQYAKIESQKTTTLSETRMPVNHVLAEAAQLPASTVSIRGVTPSGPWHQEQARTEAAGRHQFPSQAVPVKNGAQQVETHVKVTVKHASTGDEVTIDIPSTSNMIQLKRTLARKLKRLEILEHGKLVTRGAEGNFASTKEHEPLGKTTSIFLMNAPLKDNLEGYCFTDEDYRDAELRAKGGAQKAKPKAKPADDRLDVTVRCIRMGYVVEVQVPKGATALDVKDAIGKHIGRPEVVSGVLLRANELDGGYLSFQDDEQIGKRPKLYMMNADLQLAPGFPKPKYSLTEAPKKDQNLALPSKEETPCEPEMVMVTVTHAVNTKESAVELVVMDNVTIGEVKAALAQKLTSDVLQKGRFVQRKGPASFSGVRDSEPLGGRRNLMYMGISLK